MSKTLSLSRARPATHFRGRLPLSRLPITLLGLCFETLLTWQDRARSRHHLRSLGDEHLKDIGLSRADVEAEAGKPFWRA